ncbi:50S ribosomal protein L24 [bacterium]|nr:50S ribosomal protein L24 [bacterium]|tara:strand:+ start:1490 stop:1795 length:306 start_codon:yes stop_codon:yes gene_type:complete
MKIKRGDNVIIISGKDKGKEGKVLRVLSSNKTAVVEGINIKKKHQKPRRSGQKGQIIEFAAPIHASNVMLVDPKTKKRTRIGFKIENGKKVRVAKKSNTVI